MVEKVIVDGLVLVLGAASGDLAAAVDALGMYNDLSTKALTYNIEESGEVATIRPHGTNPRGRSLAVGKSGTISLTFIRDPGGTPDPGMTLGNIWRTASRRFHFAIQDDRSVLGSPVVPLASAGNPQQAGSAVMTSFNPFGEAAGAEVAVVIVNGILDRDYAEYTS